MDRLPDVLLPSLWSHNDPTIFFGFTTSPAYIQVTPQFSHHDLEQKSRLDLPKRAACRQWPIRQLLSIRRVQKHRIPPPCLHSVQPDRPVLWVLEDEKDENDCTSQARIQRGGQDVCNREWAKVSPTKERKIILRLVATRTVVLDPP